MGWWERMTDKVREGMRSFLEIQPPVARSYNVWGTVDFDGNAVKNRLWYRGQANELEQFWKETPTPSDRLRFWSAVPLVGREIEKIHTGVPALVADVLNKPFVYVRSKPKDHGLENLIEGELKPGMKVVVVEDLISTGGSSLKAVDAIRNNGCEVIGMVAAYTYGFDAAKEAFKKANVQLITLTNYEAVLDVALKTGYITENQVSVLNTWRKDPSQWKG